MGKFRGNQHTENEYDEYSYDELVDDVRQLRERLGETPTTRDAMKDDTLPCLARIYDVAPGSWQDVLEDAGVGQTQVEQYGPEEREKMIRDMRRVQRESGSHVLTTREYDEDGAYPTSVVKEYFGSWDEACTAAGVERGTKHGTNCTGPQGERLDSKLELAIARMLDRRGIEYVVHPPVRETNWIGDFYLPDIGLWIEVDGYSDSERPNSSTFEEKLGYYDEHDMDFEVVTTTTELSQCLKHRG